LNKTKSELIDIARANASLSLDSSKFSKSELIDIARAIHLGSTLSLYNCYSKTKMELIDIARAAPGKVIFS
jgi:hypothetical protein